ncbi:acyl-CoA thioesterase [Marinomonas epiphytica]
MESITPPNECKFIVRDYECDMQGIVNNAVYQNYLEHARHEFIKSKGLDFAEITLSGINLVLIKAEIDYKRSLKSSDNFVVRTHVQRSSKLKFAFIQTIHRLEDDNLILKAVMTVTATTAQGRPIVFEQAHKLLDEPLG